MPHERPPADTFDFVGGWRCPLCSYGVYDRVAVSKGNGKPYMTEFYECSGCTVMFRHPGKFARLGVPIRRWANDIEPLSLADAQKYRITSSGKSGKTE